jgi:hypothetical protein
MYRFVTREQVIYGHFKQYLDANNKMNDYVVSKGMAPARLMVPTIGVNNEAIWESEYESLADLEREMDALQSDPEFMTLVRESAGHIIQGSARTELLQTMPDIA